jgi:hypothetical protein
MAWRTIVARCARVSEVSFERSCESGTVAAVSVLARERLREGRVRVAGMCVRVSTAGG